jgi:hypothetical protein
MGPGIDIAPTPVTALARPATQNCIYCQYERDLLHRIVGMADPGRANIQILFQMLPGKSCCTSIVER